MADPSKYLLPTERVAISTRRHWAYLAGDTLQAIVLLLIGVLLARILNGVDFVGTVLIWFCVFVFARWAWKIADWYNETLIVTDKRLLLLTGIFYRNVAIMPLVKVTDLTYHRSASGMTFGYGKFVVESAGQDQALSTIDFVPHPDRLYSQISDLLFGGDKGAPGALVTTAQRMAEEENDQLARRRFRRRFARRRPDRPAGRAARERPGPVPAGRDPGRPGHPAGRPGRPRLGRARLGPAVRSPQRTARAGLPGPVRAAVLRPAAVVRAAAVVRGAGLGRGAVPAPVRPGRAAAADPPAAPRGQLGAQRGGPPGGAAAAAAPAPGRAARRGPTPPTTEHPGG